MQRTGDDLDQIGKALHDHVPVTHEPLPWRWVELINFLDERERSLLQAPKGGMVESAKPNFRG